MEIYLKSTAAILITVVLVLALSKQQKDIAVLLVMFACCAVIICGIGFLEPVISFFYQLQELGQLDSDLMKILLKVVGIGLLAEIVGLICADTGNAALGKSLQLLASAVVLWLSIPLLQTLIEFVNQILGEV